MSRRISALASGALLLALAWLGGGCAETGTTMVSKGDVRAPPAGRRLLVISQLAWADPSWAEAFEKAAMAELKRTGVTVAVQTRNPLALHADKVRYAAQLAEFKPDSVLVIEASDGAVDQAGRSLWRKFEAGLFRRYAERTGRELTWRASIRLEPAGPFITPGDMPALARDLVARLAADGLIPKPVPVRRGTAPVRRRVAADKDAGAPPGPGR